jgi:ribulose-phosphate 3-epimerase
MSFGINKAGATSDAREGLHRKLESPLESARVDSRQFTVDRPKAGMSFGINKREPHRRRERGRFSGVESARIQTSRVESEKCGNPPGETVLLLLSKLWRQIVSQVHRGFMALIAPALLAADFARLGDALRIFESVGCRRCHIDVADGHFAQELTVGQPVFQSIRKATRLELDLHLLVERPERYIPDFAGADRIALHPESTPQFHRALDLVRRQGSRPGVALLPATPVEAVTEVLDEVDFVAILARDPVFGPDSEDAPNPGDGDPQPPALGLRKVGQAVQIRAERGLRFEVHAEYGVRAEHLRDWAEAGADILIGGFAIFATVDPEARLRDLIRRAETGSSAKA